MSVHQESVFESSIEDHLLANTWGSVDPKSYDRKLGVFGAEYIEFVKTHLRTAVTSEESLSLAEGTDKPGVALPGEGKGKPAETPMDRLSTLIANLNEVLGKGLGEPDKVWVQQGFVAVMASEEMRSIALDTDKAQ